MIPISFDSLRCSRPGVVAAALLVAGTVGAAAQDQPKPLTYHCDATKDKTIEVTFINSTNPPTARLVRGGQTVVLTLGMSGSGSRYLDKAGRLFWIKGQGAQVEWPKGTAFNCQTKD